MYKAGDLGTGESGRRERARERDRTPPRHPGTSYHHKTLPKKTLQYSIGHIHVESRACRNRENTLEEAQTIRDQEGWGGQKRDIRRIKDIPDSGL